MKPSLSLQLYAVSGKASVTVDLHVACISAAPLYSSVRFECRVERLGRSTHFSTCRLFLEAAPQDETPHAAAQSAAAERTAAESAAGPHKSGKGGRDRCVAHGTHTKHVVAASKGFADAQARAALAAKAGVKGAPSSSLGSSESYRVVSTESCRDGSAARLQSALRLASESSVRPHSRL